MERLRVFTGGEVDDGKSTLMGRLLCDSQSVYEDQIADAQTLGKLDYSRILDGLLLERKQGITIDVAYRSFETAARSFILLDAPGHPEFLSNAVSAASQADVLLLVLSVEHPLSVQAKRHAEIASLLGVRHAVIAVNKLDLVDYRQEAFERVCREYREFAQKLSFQSTYFLPISALRGDNVFHVSSNMPWHTGAALLDHFETLPILPYKQTPWRLPIQGVLNALGHPPFYTGTLVGSSLKIGDLVLSLPSRQTACVQKIVHAAQEVQQAENGQAIAVCLDRNLDLSRGCLLACPEHPPQECWHLDVRPIPLIAQDRRIGQEYGVMHTTQTVSAKIEKSSPHRMRLSLDKPLFVDEYTENKTMGSCILIDLSDYQTVLAGLIVSKKGFWISGLSGAGKSTLAHGLQKRLNERGEQAYVLDGDGLRRGVNADLGFSQEDRQENARRAAEIAKLIADAGIVPIVALIASPEPKYSPHFFQIYLNTPLACCEGRDPKGLYRQARAGRLPQFTGISFPFIPPESPDLTLDTSELSVDACVEAMLKIWDAH